MVCPVRSIEPVPRSIVDVFLETRPRFLLREGNAGVWCDQPYFAHYCGFLPPFARNNRLNLVRWKSESTWRALLMNQGLCHDCETPPNNLCDLSTQRAVCFWHRSGSAISAAVHGSVGCCWLLCCVAVCVCMCIKVFLRWIFPACGSLERWSVRFVRQGRPAYSAPVGVDASNRVVVSTTYRGYGTWLFRDKGLRTMKCLFVDSMVPLSVIIMAQTGGLFRVISSHVQQIAHGPADACFLVQMGACLIFMLGARCKCVQYEICKSRRLVQRQLISRLCARGSLPFE